MFVELPRYISYSHRGVNSPVILRTEAGFNDGGMLVEEFRDAPPNIVAYGAITDARAAFENALAKLHTYVDGKISESKPSVSDRWFRIEYRGPNCVATFWGDDQNYDLQWVTAPGAALTADFSVIYDRLLLIYQYFFNVESRFR